MKCYFVICSLGYLESQVNYQHLRKY